MKNSIVIGPIQKAKRVTERSTILDNRLSKMKIGNFFEVTGLSGKEEVRNFRASVQYFSKKKGIQVTTSVTKGVLRVQRIKFDKTKESSIVK
jgi:hypothetical protein